MVFIQIFMLEQNLNQCDELNRSTYLQDNNNNLERIKVEIKKKLFPFLARKETLLVFNVPYQKINLKNQ